ncbi:MAG: diguanylate cyclase [Rubrobacter sp.]|nr:diguanylate cyclase [Rubrobacter sp.]
MSPRLKRMVKVIVGLALAMMVVAGLPAVAEAKDVVSTKDDSSAPSAVPNRMSIVVRPGDSLWSISQERLAPNATPQRILNGTEQMYTLNRRLIGADPNLIFVGQELLVPPAMASGRPTGPTPASGTAGKTTGAAEAAEAAEAGPRDRTAKGRTGSKATGKAPRTAAGGADAKVGNVSAPVAEGEAEPVSVHDEAVAEPVSVHDEAVASNGTRVEGRRVLGLGIWLLTLVVVALMAWKLPMRRTTREDAERWGIPTGFYYGAPAAHRNNAPLASRPGSPGARDREGARGEGIPQPPGPEQWGVSTGTGDTPAANGVRNAAAARQVRKAKPEASPRNGLANDGFGAYALLSWLGFPKSYRGKIMLVAFLGTHAPLIALALYLLLLGSSIGLEPALRLFVVVVPITLIGTGATLLALRGLLAPMSLTVSALEQYIDDRKVPALPASFTDEAGKLMASVQYAIGHLDETVRSLEDLSATDHLTGLLNRRQGEKVLAEEAAKLRRGKEMVTLGVVDLNKLKHINDTYGHQAGDACIRHVADVIRRHIRQGDWLARWGGDEFVLVLCDANSFALTEVVLQRIVEDLKDSPVRLPRGEELTLSVTVGASRYSGEEDLWELLDKADEAMYEAKREGRSWILST